MLAKLNRHDFGSHPRLVYTRRRDVATPGTLGRSHGAALAPCTTSTLTFRRKTGPAKPSSEGIDSSLPTRKVGIAWKRVMQSHGDMLYERPLLWNSTKDLSWRWTVSVKL
jgi:hypothetical protein